MKGLSIIVRDILEYDAACEFIGNDYCYIPWVPQMAERETAVVVWAKKSTDSSSGSVGCTERQRAVGIRTVEFSQFFKVKE